MRDYFLKTDRIAFAKWNCDDTRLAELLWGNEQVSRYICASGVFSTEEIHHRLKTEIDKQNKFGIQYWPIFEIQSDEFIGCCGLRPKAEGVCEMGVHLRPEFWGRGYAFEAANAVIEYAFNVLGVDALFAGHNPNNIASKKLINKLGFSFVGNEFYEPTGLYHPSYLLKGEKHQMKKLLYIDACIRDDESRTKRIAEPLIAELKKRYSVETLVLNDLPLEIVKKELLEKRLGGDIEKTVIGWAESVRDADRIVISAPFWDMSIPAALKVFIELCSIFNVTFTSDDKICHGLCKAEKLLFITTRGMDIATGDELEQATPYLKALSWLWGIGPMQVVSAQNMDYASPEGIEEKIITAIREGMDIVRNF